MITQLELKNLLHYNQTTGIFTWKTSNSKKIKIGNIAGGLDKFKYVIITVNNKAYKAHRLAWLYVYGTWPNIIDHLNGIKSDNRINNLREVTYRENQQNQYKHRGGHLVGTCFHKHNKKWRSQININGQIIHLGYYNTQEEAHKAYVIALKEGLR